VERISLLPSTSVCHRGDTVCDRGDRLCDRRHSVCGWRDTVQTTVVDSTSYLMIILDTFLVGLFCRSHLLSLGLFSESPGDAFPI